MSCNSCWLSPRWREFVRAAALCLAFSASAAGSAAQAGWRDELPQARAVGAGELRWFGLRIYHAALWSERQPFDPDARFALQLTYYRSISRERLVQASMDEMRRLGNAPREAATQERWAAQLRQAFTDVEGGDQLIGVYLPGHGMRMYDRNKLLADMPDPQLAQAFFAIWLHPASRDQDLRRKLLGGAP